MYYLEATMLKYSALLKITICAAASLAISQPAYAQISEFKITASDGAADDYFGNSVSISGDYAVVGAPNDTDNERNSGSAYVFKRTGTSWAQEAKLLASDGAAFHDFGVSVSISGDYAVVGAPNDNDNGSQSGSAYVFKRTGTSWTQEAKLLASDGAVADIFGTSVSISGDYAVVGAPGFNVDPIVTGSAYVFKRTGTSWAQEAKLLASDGAPNDRFGGSVSISGDYAVVGAFLDVDNGVQSGSAYVFKRTGTSWVEEAKLLASDRAAGDEFGFGSSVSISGDNAVVGARQDDDNGSGSGSAYVYNGFITDLIILSVQDIPDDQGNQVRVTWTKSPNERDFGDSSVVKYSLWRLDSVIEGEEPRPSFIVEMPILGLEQYSYVAPTLGNTTSEKVFLSGFKFIAHTAFPWINFDSQVRYGESIDNLAPDPPLNMHPEDVSSTGPEIGITWT